MEGMFSKISIQYKANIETKYENSIHISNFNIALLLIYIKYRKVFRVQYEKSHERDIIK